ncbi:MAG TPA: pitrilysin family protein [Thermoanaerobaculia bacterium]|nr:pitrilysin family protein [Thermoanaerobaculia bacterium]
MSLAVAERRRELSLPGRLGRFVLDNGLRVCVLENRVAPLVSAALWYRVGARDELPHQYGAAHFLEHMMFRGAERFGPGEIDRLTSELGGSCNAFTSHDSTVYTFRFSSDRWPIALELEADRLSSLAIDQHAFERERRVILEELSMYEDEPWDALDQDVSARMYGGHPYGRPVLGTRESLEQMTPATLRDLMRAHYRTDNAVLILAGDVSIDEAVEACSPLAAIPAPVEAGRRRRLPSHRPPKSRRRVIRRHGELARLLVDLPAPTATDLQHPVHRLAALVLGGGRSSRLHRGLVEDRRLCSWVSCDLSESEGPGVLTIALEVLPGVEPERVEDELWRTLEALATQPPSDEEILGCRRMAVADWMFAHEHGHRQALAVGAGEASFGEGWAQRSIEALVDSPDEEVRELAAKLGERGSVVGWSLPLHGAEAHD